MEQGDSRPSPHLHPRKKCLAAYTFVVFRAAILSASVAAAAFASSPTQKVGRALHHCAEARLSLSGPRGQRSYPASLSGLQDTDRLPPPGSTYDGAFPRPSSQDPPQGASMAVRPTVKVHDREAAYRAAEVFSSAVGWTSFSQGLDACPRSSSK